MALPSEVEKRLKTAKEERQPYEAVWDLAYKNYRGFIDKSEQTTKANLFIPYTFQSIENLVPRLYSNRTVFKAEGGDVLDEEGAKVIEHLLQIQWRRARMSKRLLYFIKSTLIYGLGVLKVGWKLEKWNDEVIYDDPVVWNIDNLNFYPDPSCQDFEDMDWCFFRSYYTKEELIKLGFDKNKVDKLTESKEEELALADRRAVLGLPAQGLNRKKVEVLEYWTRDSLMTFGNETEVLYDDVNPYLVGQLPAITLVDVPDVHFPYGIGEAETIFSLQDELNAMRNIRLDSAKLAVMKWFKAIKDKCLDKDLELYPGKVFSVESPEALTEGNTQGVPVAGYQESGEIKADIQTTTGVADYQKGFGGAEGMSETATGAISIQENAQLRFGIRTMLLEDTLSRLGKMFYELDRKYVDTPRMMRMASEKGIQRLTLDPRVLEPDVDIIFDAGVNLPVQKAVKRNQALALYDRWNGDPFINQIELRKIVVQNFDELIKNPNALLTISSLPPEVVGKMSPEMLTMLQQNPNMMQLMVGQGEQSVKKGEPGLPAAATEDIARQGQGTAGISGGFLGGMAAKIKRRLFGRGRA